MILSITNMMKNIISAYDEGASIHCINGSILLKFVNGDWTVQEIGKGV